MPLDILPVSVPGLARELISLFPYQAIASDDIPVSGRTPMFSADSTPPFPLICGRSNANIYIDVCHSRRSLDVESHYLDGEREDPEVAENT